MLYKKLDMLEEEDFAYFRSPFDSGRQTPKNVRKGLLIAVVVQIFIMIVAYGIYNSSSDAILDMIVFLFTELVTITLIILSFIYSVSAVFRSRQHVQYILGNLNLLNIIGTLSFNAILFLLKTDTGTSQNTIIIVALTGVLLLLAFFITALIRLYRSLLKGTFREDSATHGYEKALEKDREIVSKLPESIVGLIGLILFVQYLFTNLTIGIENMIMMTVMFLVPYVGLYSFSHALITYYCKKRFASFNFDAEGNLQPWGSGDKVRDKERTQID